MKLLNAFTPGMLPEFPATVQFMELTVDKARAFAAHGLESCVGHQGSAEMYSAILGVPVSVNRVTTRFEDGEVALLGQYTGPRLVEGQVLSAAELAAAPMRWLLVWTILDDMGHIADREVSMGHGYGPHLPQDVRDVLNQKP